MIWPDQATRFRIYKWASLPLFVSFFLLGDYVWITFVVAGFLAVAGSLECCPQCGRTLMFNVSRGRAHDPIICDNCADPLPPAPPLGPAR